MTLGVVGVGPRGDVNAGIGEAAEGVRGLPITPTPP